MDEALEIHVANLDERREHHVNVHDVWSMGLALEAHIARRMTSALHTRATWIVGKLAGRVVTGLASHPIQFKLHGETVQGIGIASVHTLPEFRGHGFAPQIIRWAEEYERPRGARLSLLYCDVKPTYYGRQGYLLCPSHIGWRDITSADKRDDGGAVAALDVDRWRLVSFAGAEGIEHMAELYESDYGHEPLLVERSPAYWQHLVDRNPKDDFLWLANPSGERDGFARLAIEKGALFIRDMAVRNSNESLRDRLLELVARLGVERGFARVGSWLPATAAARMGYQIAPRPDEISMIKSLDADLVLDDGALAAADRFQEIDHV